MNQGELLDITYHFDDGCLITFEWRTVDITQTANKRKYRRTEYKVRIINLCIVGEPYDYYDYSPRYRPSIQFAETLHRQFVKRQTSYVYKVKQ